MLIVESEKAAGREEMDMELLVLKEETRSCEIMVLFIRRRRFAEGVREKAL